MGHWGPASLVSLSIHALALYFILMLPPLKAPVKRVVPVDAITMTAVVPKPEGGQAGSSGGSSSPELQTVSKPIPPPKPLPPATPKPKPKPVVKPPPPPKEFPDPEPIPRPLAMPRPAPPAADLRPTPTVTPPRPTPPSSVASSNTGLNSTATGSGIGRGSGMGTGSGTGSGSGVGSGQGTGSGRGSGTGSGAGSGAALQGYLSKVRSLLERNKIYPSQSRSRNEEGIVVVRFSISSDGSIGGVSLSRSSGHPGLDQAAQETVNRVRRFPPFPGDFQRPSLTVQVPLAYRLHGG